MIIVNSATLRRNVSNLIYDRQCERATVIEIPHAVLAALSAMDRMDTEAYISRAGLQVYEPRNYFANAMYGEIQHALVDARVTEQRLVRVDAAIWRLLGDPQRRECRNRAQVDGVTLQIVE